MFHNIVDAKIFLEMIRYFKKFLNGQIEFVHVVILIQPNLGRKYVLCLIINNTIRRVWFIAFYLLNVWVLSTCEYLYTGVILRSPGLLWALKLNFRCESDKVNLFLLMFTLSTFSIINSSLISKVESRKLAGALDSCFVLFWTLQQCPPTEPGENIANYANS